MMSDEMLKKMPHAMLQGANEMMKKPLASGAMMAGAGFAAGRGLLGKTVLGGALLRNPLTLLAVGAAGGGDRHDMVAHPDGTVGPHISVKGDHSVSLRHFMIFSESMLCTCMKSPFFTSLVV